MLSLKTNIPKPNNHGLNTTLFAIPPAISLNVYKAAKRMTSTIAIFLKLIEYNVVNST